MSMLRTLLMIAAVAFALSACSTIGDDDDRGDQPLPVKLVNEMASRGMQPADPIFVRIYKQESELEVWKRDRSGRFALLKTYPICRWSGKLGPKMRENDRQAPEGFYFVSARQLNPKSQYHLSFNLGYPNALETALGYKGSALMVHGACTSSGCFAMSDSGVGDIYALAREAIVGGQQSIQVQSLPFRMTAANLAAHRGDANMSFWLNLKEGVDRFDVTRQPPWVAACGRRYAFGLDPAGASKLDPLSPCPRSQGDPSVSALVAAKASRDAAQVAELSASTSGTRSYVDGGMNASFRTVLLREGVERLAAKTSSKAPVSRPEAALADPFAPAAAEPGALSGW